MQSLESNLRNNSNTLGLRFDLRNDAFNFSREEFKHYLRRLPADDLNLIESYEQAKLEIVLKICVLPDLSEYDLIFSSIPNRSRFRYGHESTRSCFDPVASSSDPNWGNQFMLIPITYFIECPQKIIPSFVRLELPKKRLNFWGNNFRGSALEGVLKSSSITGKGEVGDLGSSLLRSNSEGMGNGVDGLVQG